MSTKLIDLWNQLTSRLPIGDLCFLLFSREGGNNIRVSLVVRWRRDQGKRGLLLQLLSLAVDFRK